MLNTIAPLTAKQAAKLLNISTNIFYRLVRQNLIRPIPGIHRYARAEIERFARGEK